MVKIAINGFGRIGRLFFREAFNKENIEVVAVNDLGNVDNLAYLLKYDTVYRQFGEDIKADGENLVVNGRSTKFFQIKNPEELPWGELGVDVVIEATGVFDSYEKAAAHIKAGAKKVVITAPAKDEDGELGKTVLMGINEDEAETCDITSNGSCTTNAASPVISVLNESLGIEKAMLNTIHSYTATQNIVDGTTKSSDFRRGRAGAQNIVPSTTGAAIAVTRAVRELSGNFDGIAIRIPFIIGSIADITFISKKETTVEEVNNILKKAAEDPRWKNMLAVTDEPLVSSDIIAQPYGSIVDLKFTKVVGGNLVKVLSWYDNEMGYVATLIRHALEVAKKIK
jgi:glyceraldehyde 3-phosphate dehydrogenase